MVSSRIDAFLEAHRDDLNDGEKLEDSEEFWRDRYEWLKERGYLLRPRYCPGRIPSWKGTNRRPRQCEDSHIPLHPFLVDAVRTRDNKIVMLRRPDPPSESDELKIQRVFASEPARSDPRNHCIPLYEILELDVPDPVFPTRNLILVMPYLTRWDVDVHFTSAGEVVDFCSQIFEGLQFMHSLRVAHNDAKTLNIMMDWYPVYRSPPHPLNPSRKYDWSGYARPRNRTRYPVKYHFIDFDLSRQFDPTNTHPLQNPGYGGDQSVPEFIRKEACNPFAVDVYYLGNVIRRTLLLGVELLHAPKRNVEFLQELIADMTHDDPTKRPSMDQVVARFEQIRRQLPWWKLRSRVSEKHEHPLVYFFGTSFHWARQFTYIVRRVPAIPQYTNTPSN